MKFVGRTFIIAMLLLYAEKVICQDLKGNSAESNEIIIQQNGNQSEQKISVEINGDKVLINGKPISEFNQDGVTIKKRKMVIADGSPLLFDEDFGAALGDLSTTEEKTDSIVFLGVSTEKVEDGAKIIAVTKESAAEKAGLKEGDIITNLGGKKIEDAITLMEAVQSHKAKEEVSVTYKRDGKEKKTKAILQLKKQIQRKIIVMNSGRRPMHGRGNGFPPPPPPPGAEEGFGLGAPEINQNFDGPPPNPAMPRPLKLGLKIQDTEDGKGVKILDVVEKSPAFEAGLKKDDIITSIADVAINNTDDFREMIHHVSRLPRFQFKYNRNGSENSVEIVTRKKMKTEDF
jgi:serine protease Do